MDFSKYSNIDAIYKSKIGFKKSLLNKNMAEDAIKSWQSFSEKEMKIIDEEITDAPRVYNNIITSVALIWNNKRLFMAIPIKDILWVYNSVIVSRMNFIPYDKTHTLNMLTKSGNTYELGESHVGGFSKKTPNDQYIEMLKEVLDKYRPNVIYGYSDELATLFANDFKKGVELVDKGELK